ncbi:hypothetical protein [Rhodococcus daqingensis]|uniref:Uncharacterized protein n=1 Tax=Rhodococcus daqingensis TaxID=2479363 RepID=A0ABW2RSL0_9NOCA
MQPTSDVIEQILRQAIEGGGVVGRATIDEWDGVSKARITERGGTVHVLDEAVAQRGIAEFLADDANDDPDGLDALTAHDGDRVDGDLADSVVQLGLFGRIVYL